MSKSEQPEPWKYEPYIDGHELSFLSMMVGCAVLIDRTLPNGWVKHFIHRHPGPALATGWACLGLGLMMVGPRVRRLMGLSTDNYNHEAPGAYKQKWRRELEI